MDLELKFREAPMSWNHENFDWKFLGTWWNLANSFLCTPYLKEKINSKQVWVKNLKFLQGRIWIDFAVVWNVDLIFKFHLWIYDRVSTTYLLMTLIRVSITQGVTTYLEKLSGWTFYFWQSISFSHKAR
jgi:hypothetical protein